ncbi:DUF4230 domain-containing protein [Sulfurimonas sp. HSL-3221]|uniref:DUF4230 domain-containing protein n=1 Tax=Sulfurimonadaceae TaxID=2771471 RepID=UPI001E34FF50|nr:DUF4230 domain-containing protein [Sulfurimonas sp. HSL-3221]UFS61757.1 DUF4230 domain-containing protein [Sulfurimonas sp. HSL-3221]
MDNVIMFFSGLLLAGGIAVLLWYLKRTKKEGPANVTLYSTIEKMESLGNLNVYKVVTKEIVTASDHIFGNFGEKYLRWLISKKKLAMIFTFDIDFSYNLKDSRFGIEELGEGQYLFKMPECRYSLSIKDISFYDEQNGKLLPWLLPDLIAGVFSDGFDENDRNALIKEAKKQVSAIANGMMIELLPDVQKSARTTLEQIAFALNAASIQFDFSESPTIENTVDYLPGNRTEAQLPPATEA